MGPAQEEEELLRVSLAWLSLVLGDFVTLAVTIVRRLCVTLPGE